MDSNCDAVVAEFVEEILATRKYRLICEDTVRDVIVEALPKYKRSKDAVKAARTKLHRIQAAYLGRNRLLERLDDVRAASQAGDQDALKSICLDLMTDHASTRERIPYLDRFYEPIFDITGLPHSVLDVASGVHPLAMPWMGLSTDTVYYAYEIAKDLVDGLNGFMEAIGMMPRTRFQDVICKPPTEEAELAFLMKMVPCLERRQKGIALNLIASLRVRYVVVTFPVQSLSGRSKNMPEHYTKTFTESLRDTGWRLTHAPMDGELVFVVDKHP